MEDDIKEKWIHQNDLKSIQELDARRSDVRDENVFEMIANRWNSNSFNPTTMVMTCHYDFLQDKARKIRFKIFESSDSQKRSEEAFYRSELSILENEITKCNNELGSE